SSRTVVARHHRWVPWCCCGRGGPFSAGRSAHAAFVKVAENPGQRRRVLRSQVSVADWRDYQVPDQPIGGGQCVLDAASIRAVGNVQFCGNFLMSKDQDPIPTDWLVQDRQQLILGIGGVPKLQLGYRPRLGMVLPKALSENTSAARRRSRCNSGSS